MEDGIRMGVRGVEWIKLAQDRGPVAGCFKCGDEPSGYGATKLVTSAAQQDAPGFHTTEQKRGKDQTTN
jgi:hypothetical protein